MSWIIAGKEGTRYELYAQMEERYGRNHERKCINGKYAASCKCTGFCTYPNHPGFITGKQMEEHQCHERGCRHLLAKPTKIRTIRIGEKK